MACLQILLPLFIAVALSLRFAFLAFPLIALRHSDPLVALARDHLYDIITSVQRTTFTSPCLLPLVSRHVPWCQYPSLVSASEGTCQVLNDVLYDAHALADRFVDYAASPHDFATAVSSAVNVLDRFLSVHDGVAVPDQHQPLVHAAREVRALVTESLEAIAGVVVHGELTVSCMAAIELTVDGMLRAPRWLFTDAQGSANVALHNVLHIFVSSATTSATYLDDSLSVAGNSTKRVLTQLEDLSALSRGAFSSWKCPWPVIDSTVDEPMYLIPLPCAASLVAHHCIIRMAAVHDILLAIREDVVDLVNDLTSRTIPTPPSDRCPLDVTAVKYHGHAQLLQKQSLVVADFRSRVYARLSEIRPLQVRGKE